ncbi:hypothetical protein B0H63DRAFT_426949 [Podospora didyma]|uniref:NmrA-like domain-containing protein n=1 Tax=Podospora didyma TaxID=330526 RepID=A0AAE0P829_9PEZI|nr:hypothetical protein B0H63DRAFT_426949 [Podospora didyma]
MKSIGIFPASGGLGGSTYRHLLEKVPNEKVVLISRHPEKIPEKYLKAGVQTRQASYESSISDLETVFAGIETLFLISYPSHVREYRIKVQLPAIDAARRTGVTHIFYSSLAFGGDAQSNHSVAEVMQAHLATEAYLRKLASEDKSFTYTILRMGLYAESTPIYTAFFSPKAQPTVSEILIPHDGSGMGIAWIEREELGEATARLIARYAEEPDTFQFVNETVLLTGTKVWTLEDTVKVLAEIAGTDIKIREVSVDEYVKLKQVQEIFGSEEKARTWSTAWEAIRAGEAAVVTSQMEEILGRKPEEFEASVKRYWGVQ